MIYTLLNWDGTVSQKIILGCILLIVLVFSLSIHELMHGYTAYRLGDDTARLQGRLTLNPLAHLDPVGTLMMLIAGFGWAKPVQVNYGKLTRYKNRSISIRLVSIAGVTSNFVVAVISYLLSTAVYLIGIKTVSVFYVPSLDAAVSPASAVISVIYFLFYFFYNTNLMLMAFNLLPIPPLDGYHFVETFLPYKWRQIVSGYERYISYILLILIVVGNMSGFNILGTLIRFIETPFIFIIETPIDALASAIYKIM